jgi:hypothetical protein
MSDTCRKCKADVPLTNRECAVCNTDAGFPNVRVAGRESEAAALTARYDDAKVSAKARNIVSELKAFEDAVASSKAVMNRSLGALSDWLNGSSALFLSFHNQVKHQGRVPNDTDFDQQREAAEAAINPYCYQELSFAALTLDGRGTTYYGPYSVTLKSVTIEDRASVFEKNPFYFNKIHHVVAGQPPPRGYRSPWDGRERLAVAKLQAQIASGCAAAEFPNILMEGRRDESDCDFVEVHIFGPVNRLGIEHIVGPEPTIRADRLVWKQVARKAKEYGAVVEVTT